jgi:S-methylmethionine-dependent homocysteine/selenocysteine methylase
MPLARPARIHADYVACGVDAVTANTFRTQRRTLARAGIGDRAEALTRRAVELARSAAGSQAWVFGSSPTLEDSFVCWEGARLLSGEPLADALRAAADEGACAVLANCMPPSNADPCLDALAAQALPFGIYPNLGAPEDELGFRRSEDVTPEQFAAFAAGWAARGARVIGGCCGTTPAHLAAVAARLRA